MNEVVEIIPKRKPRKKPATITIIREDGAKLSLQMADFKDWGIIYEDILEVEVEDGSKRYFPTGGLQEWKVEEDA